MRVCEDKKNYSKKCFQPVRYRDYEDLSNQKTPLEYIKILNAYSICSRTSRNYLEGERYLVAVMKQWNGEKREINFYWTSIFMMGMNIAHVLISFDLNLQKFCET